MPAMIWQPWSFFLMLDYFSRAYFVGVLLVTICSLAIFRRIILGTREMKRGADSSNEPTYLNLARMNHNLHSLMALGMTFTSACCVNQIFGVWFVYMARVTDANPFLALREAWVVAQVLMCLLIILDCLRRYGSAILERSRPQSRT
jgi:hypothetical protein